MRYALKLSALAAFGLSLTWLAMPIGSAQAQNMGSKGIKPVVGAAPNKRPDAAAPSGLPGARGPEGGAAPATTLPSDMQPTDALFDAINRGDIVTARDAMGRGADMSAHNILGMTPLELSIDLSRNDITFFLLSLRGSDDSRAPAKALADKSGKSAPKPAGAAPAPKTARNEQVRKPAVQTPVAARSSSPQYAGGGTPDPAAGFLGFGGGT